MVSATGISSSEPGDRKSHQASQGLRRNHIVRRKVRAANDSEPLVGVASTRNQSLQRVWRDAGIVEDLLSGARREVFFLLFQVNVININDEAARHYFDNVNGRKPFTFVLVRESNVGICLLPWKYVGQIAIHDGLCPLTTSSDHI